MDVRTGLFVVLSVATFVFAHERATSKHTYNQHVRPIFEKHCAECHSSGGIGPMSLMTYNDASPWSAAIRTQVLERTMPPFLPEEGAGDFRAARYLSAREIEAIVDWATGGTPEGDPVTFAAVIPSETPAPDILLPLAMTLVPADEMEKIVCTRLPQRNVVLRAIAFQPGNREMVHDAKILTGCGTSATPVAAWLPGDGVITWPDGYGVSAPSLAVKIHYKKTWRHDGKELRDQSQVGLYFAPASAKPIRIAKKLTGSATIFGLMPEGPGMIEADGKPILQIDRFDPAWQGRYVFREPVFAQTVKSEGNFWFEYRPGGAEGR